MTKLKTRFALFLVLGLAAVAMASMKPWEMGSPDKSDLRPHTPSHKIAQQSGQILRFSAYWEHDQAPDRVVYHIGGSSVTLEARQLPTELQHWSLEVPYDPKMTYALEVFQAHDTAHLTSCEIRILGPGFGFGDKYVLQAGRGTARCWINAGI